MTTPPIGDSSRQIFIYNAADAADDDDPEMSRILDVKQPVKESITTRIRKSITIRRAKTKKIQRPSILPRDSIDDKELPRDDIEAKGDSELARDDRKTTKNIKTIIEQLQSTKFHRFTRRINPSITPPAISRQISSVIYSSFLPPQSEAPPLVEVERKPYNSIDLSVLPSSHELYTNYDAYAANIQLLFEASDKIFLAYKQICPEYEIRDIEKYEGFAEEISVPTDTNLVIRADIHGSWEVFKNYIEKLKSDGYLDDNLRCKNGRYITFLGDFTGRNIDDLFITNVIATMKLQQPEQIHILKGNHEEKSYINLSNDPDSLLYKYATSSDERKNLINSFSDNLPLNILFHENNYENYVACAHGVIDPAVNLKPLIRNPKTNILFIPQLTLRNFCSFRKNISLYDPNDNSSFSKELWNNLLQEKSKYFIAYSSAPSEYFHLSSFTWGTALPLTSSYTFDNTPDRHAGDISCSIRVLRELGEAYNIYSMYFGHAHYHQEFLREEPNKLQVKILTWEAADPYYEIDAAVVIFNNGEIHEFPIQKMLPEAEKEQATEPEAE